MRALALTALLGATSAGAQTVALDLAPGLTAHFATAPFDPDVHDACERWHGTGGAEPAAVLDAARVVLDGARVDLDPSCVGFNAEVGRPLDPGAFAWVEATPNGDGQWTVGGVFGEGEGRAEVAWRVGPYGSVRDRLRSEPAAAGGEPRAPFPTEADLQALDRVREVLETAIREPRAARGNMLRNAVFLVDELRRRLAPDAAGG